MAEEWWIPKAEKLTRREWSRLIESWYEVEGLGTSLPVPVSDHVSQLPTFRNLVVEYRENDPHEVLDVPGLRAAVMSEANMLLLKAISVLGGAQIHVLSGACGWSLSSGYHAAFFACKAILNLFGVTFIELDKTFLVDVWHAPEALSTKRQRRGEVAPFRTLIIKTSKARLDHQPIWGFFQRMLRQVMVDPALWSQEIISLLLNLDDDHFARQRNQLHYQAGYWPEPPELDAFCRIDGFASQADILDLHNDCTVGERDFSVRLGYLCVWLGIQLFSSLNGLPVLDLAYQRQRRALNQECHSLYRRATSAPATE
jgi:hypothetical protein